MTEPSRFRISWDNGAYYVSIPNYQGGEVVPASIADDLVKALELAEDILSRAPFSTAILPNGMHPQTVIEQVRGALAAVKGAPDHG
jgi:hypothetical protein